MSTSMITSGPSDRLCAGSAVPYTMKGVGRAALSRLLNGATGISPEMALRLSKALGTSPEFWYGMQVNFDLWQAKKKFRGKVRPIVQGPISAA